jgi:hypothetical protein
MPVLMSQSPFLIFIFMKVSLIYSKVSLIYSPLAFDLDLLRFLFFPILIF